VLVPLLLVLIFSSLRVLREYQRACVPARSFLEVKGLDWCW